MVAATSVFVSSLVALSILAAIVLDVFFAEPGRSLFRLTFRLRRLCNWLPMGLVYSAFYTARYNMAAANVPSVQQQSGSGIPTALALSLGFWSYAVTAPWTGLLADSWGGRYALLFATWGAALCNVGAAAASTLSPSTLRAVLVVTFYAANIVFQGAGTSAIVKVNARWYSPQERGTFSGVFNVLVTSGYYTALGAGSWVANRFGIVGLFLLPGLMLVVGGLLIATWVTNVPEEKWGASDTIAGICSSGQAEKQAMLERGNAGYGTDNKDTTEHTASSSINEEEDAKGSSRNKSRTAAARLAGDVVFLCYCAAVFFLCWVRDGLLSWLFAFLESRRGTDLSVDAAVLVGGGIAFGGFLGGVACGMASDTLFGGSRSKPILVFSCGQLFALAVLWFHGGSGSDIRDAFNLFLTCFFVCGSYTLLNYTIPSDLDPDVIGLAVGFLTTSGYMASGLAGIAMERLIAWGGFGAWMSSMAVATVLAAGAIVLGGACSAHRHESDLENELQSLRSMQNVDCRKIGQEALVLERDKAACARRRYLTTTPILSSMDADISLSMVWSTLAEEDRTILVLWPEVDSKFLLETGRVDDPDSYFYKHKRSNLMEGIDDKFLHGAGRVDDPDSYFYKHKRIFRPLNKESPI
jgi:MFS transporter, OPA family, glycerol-3-phosphate transporter